MSDKQTFLKDKPYDFVPLLEECKRTKKSNHGRIEENTYNGRLKLKITVLSPLHIGSKQEECDDEGNIIKKQMRRNGIVVIPGSSLKGAVRSIAEAVSFSCAVKLPYSELEKGLPENNKKPCAEEGLLCPACSVFGMISRRGGYRSKVTFGEFILQEGGLETEKMPLLESPFKNYPESHDVFTDSNKNYGNERLYYCKACTVGNCEECSKESYFHAVELAGKERSMKFRGRKFYNSERVSQEESSRGTTDFEMIKKDSVLRGEVLFQNLKEEEGRLLAYALNLNGNFVMKLGYGKPLGYGKIRVELEEVENMESMYGTKEKKGRELNKSDVGQWADEYTKNAVFELREVIQRLENIMK